MGAFTTIAERIIRQPALTMPGNATGSEAACTALTGSQIRAICGLGTTDNVTFNTVTATTSVLTPLVNNPSAALTLGNFTHGVTVNGDMKLASGYAIGFDSGVWNTYMGKSSNAATGLNLITASAISFTNASGTTLGRFAQTTGNFLIGTTTDDATNKLQVAGGILTTSVNNAAAALTLGNSTYGVTVPGQALVYEGQKLGWRYASGDVGPYQYLMANGAANSGEIGVYNGVSSGASNTVLRVYKYSGGYTAAVDFKNSGNVLIGTTTDDGTSKLQVAGAATFSGDISMQKATQGYIYAYDTAATTYIRMYAQNTNTYLDSTQRMWLTSATDIFVSPTNGNTLFFKSGTNSVVDVFAGNGSTKTTITHDGTNGILSTSSGALVLDPANDIIGIGGIGVNDPALYKNSNELGVRNGTNTTWATIHAKQFDADYGRLYSPNNVHAVVQALSTGYPVVIQGSGNGARIYDGTNSVDIKPVGSDSIAGVYTGYGTGFGVSGPLADWHCASISCAGITASGAIQETYRTSSLDPTVSDIGSGKRQGWYNTTATEFRDWVNVGGTLYKSAAYT